MRAIAIPAALLARMYAHARAAFPHECCGYLIGGDTVEDLVACANADAAHPDRGFVIAGRELFDFARSFDTARPARIVYHSHPNGRAYFSDTDRALALGGDTPAYPVQHVVIGVTAEAVTEAAQFAWDGGAFVEIARWVP